MEEICLEEICLYFAGAFGTRYSNKSKKTFLSVLRRRMNMAGYNQEIYNKNHKKELQQIPDYVIYGNLKKARFVFVSSFDTCSRIFLPNYLYYPLNNGKNLRFERWNLIIELIIAALCVGACAVLLWLIGVDLTFQSIRTLFTLIPIVFFGYIAFTLTGGMANTPNFNRNSAALVLMNAIANEISEKKDAAFVFCNKSCSLPEGFRLFSLERLDEVKGKIILLNCIGAGERLVIAHKEAERNMAETIISSNKGNMEITAVQLTEAETENSVFSIFPESLMLFGADEIEGEYVVKNSRSSKDRYLDTDRLEELKTLFVSI